MPDRSTSRRKFLGSCAASGAALAAAPMILGAADKSGRKTPRVGKGAHEYECLHDWGTLPANHDYGNASHGVAIDSQGLIYITHYGNPGSIFVFDPEGKLVRTLGDFHMVGGSARGHGIDIRREGSDEFLYLAASDSTLGWAKVSLKGEVVWQRGREQLQKDAEQYTVKGARYRPTNTSFDAEGGYFLGDGYGSNLIHHFDKNDKYLRTIGETGSEDGQFKTPHGQWLDDRDGTPKLAVCDRANKRLQWFDMAGKHLKTLDGFLFPADIDRQGDLLLVPDLHCRVTLLDKENQVIDHLGDDETWRAKVLGTRNMRGLREQWLPGRFVHPHDACFDKDGNIFVVEWVRTGRVTKLRKV